MQINRLIVGLLQTNCYMLVDGGELAVIDPGSEAKKISKEIVKTGAKPKFIINTHGHADHTGANRELANEFAVKIISDLKENDILTIGKEKIIIVETPGHTSDGICLFGNGFVFSGDTIFADSIGRTDLESGSDSDMAASLEKLDKLIPEGTIVYPGHGDVFKYRKGMARAWLEYLT